MKISQKKVHQLTASERDQLEVLIRRYYRSASPKFIADRLEKDYGYDIVMIKEGDLIQGVNFYHLIKHQPVGQRRPSFVLHFGQAMKRSGYRGNVIWTLGRWYSRKHISRAYLLQNVTGLASFISPKAFEHFTHLFPRFHYELKTEKDQVVRDFIDNYFNSVRGMSIDYNQGFCFDSADLAKEDITDDWQRIYRAKSDIFNQLFLKNGIVKMEGDRIYKMPRHITVCGIHRPVPFYRQLNLPCTSYLRHTA